MTTNKRVSKVSLPLKTISEDELSEKIKLFGSDEIILSAPEAFEILLKIMLLITFKKH